MLPSLLSIHVKAQLHCPDLMSDQAWCTPSLRPPHSCTQGQTRINSNTCLSNSNSMRKKMHGTHQSSSNRDSNCRMTNGVTSSSSSDLSQTALTSQQIGHSMLSVILQTSLWLKGIISSPSTLARPTQTGSVQLLGRGWQGCLGRTALQLHLRPHLK